VSHCSCCILFLDTVQVFLLALRSHAAATPGPNTCAVIPGYIIPARKLSVVLVDVASRGRAARKGGREEAGVRVYTNMEIREYAKRLIK
jgi:hypothetical protein